MTARKNKTTEVDRSQYLNYLKKADEFYKTMLLAEKNSYWNAVGLNAVHCSISIADAMLVKHRGVRSVDTDHMIVVELIRQHLEIPGISEKLGTLRRILAKKSLIEYDNSVFSQKDAAWLIDCFVLFGKLRSK